MERMGPQFVKPIIVLFVLFLFAPALTGLLIEALITPASEQSEINLKPGESPSKYSVVTKKNGIVIHRRAATEADIRSHQQSEKLFACLLGLGLFSGIVVASLFLIKRILGAATRKRLRLAGSFFSLTAGLLILVKSSLAKERMQIVDVVAFIYFSLMLVLGVWLLLRSQKAALQA